MLLVGKPSDRADEPIKTLEVFKQVHTDRTRYAQDRIDDGDTWKANNDIGPSNGFEGVSVPNNSDDQYQKPYIWYCNMMVPKTV